ncbi:transposase family protein [Kitasatospora sp. NPDC088391]|uniref:transposase family protein n=1 Tax=Kitasatospora sp. NPDC088391 TaxID=3364074 RepID=UPI00380EACA6
MIADLVAELGPVWQARREAELLDRPRQRSVGTGAKYKPVFVDRLLATLVHLRHGVTHDVLACRFGVDRSTVTRTVGEIRPLPAERGCRIAPGLRLRTLADVIGHLGATEIRGRRPAANRPGRNRFVPGKSRTNAMKALVVTDDRGRMLFCGEVRAGSVADIPRPATPAWSACWPTRSTWKFSRTPAARAWEPGPAARWSLRPANAAASTSSRCNGSWPTTNRPASPTPHAVCRSNTASPTSGTGAPSPATTAAATGCPTPSDLSPDSSPTNRTLTQASCLPPQSDGPPEQQGRHPAEHDPPPTMHEVVKQ